MRGERKKETIAPVKNGRVQRGEETTQREERKEGGRKRVQRKGKKSKGDGRGEAGLPFIHFGKKTKFATEKV